MNRPGLPCKTPNLAQPSGRTHWFAPSLFAITLALTAVASAATSEETTSLQKFLSDFCTKCHGAEKQKGDVRLDGLTGDVEKEAERLSVVLDQIRDGDMPPKKEKQPDATQRKAVVTWISTQLGGHAQPRPNQGNLVPHELLFGTSASAVTPPAPRLWRLSPEAYMGFVDGLKAEKAKGLVQPFTVNAERGIKDYAKLAVMDEPSVEVLMRNAIAIVDVECAFELVDGKLRGKNDSRREFVELMDPAMTPTRAQLEKAVQIQFRAALARNAEADEVARLLALYDKCAQSGDHPSAVKTMLSAVLLRSDAMFRQELGDPATNRLTPRETATAISLALGDKREQKIFEAAENGALTTQEQIATHIRRILDDPKFKKPRLLGFFREYFGYRNAPDVFKDKPLDLMHEPQQHADDTDHLVLHILNQDREVLRELLTTPLTFMNVRVTQDKQTRQDKFVRAREGKDKGREIMETVYGFEKWPEEQPVMLAKDTRLGILMQPSWLIAWSGNFDNDIVRRARFIRERLLGGTVPDLPIGFAAQVPGDRQRTLRDRMQVTRAEACWKCHQRMDDLGLPFENFDHYGRLRSAELVEDVAATAANVDKKGKPLGPIERPAALDTTGLIIGTGDAKLDGPVSDPRELVQKLAASERVRQVFVRHVFRYYMGRNESLADAKTLQDADRAYVESAGSYKALLVSLLTSDSFLKRASAKP